MTERQVEPEITRGRLFAINLLGVVGLVWGAGAVLCYLLGYDDAFPTRPYRWLSLNGSAELLPPAVVLVAALAGAFLLERSAKRSRG